MISLVFSYYPSDPRVRREAEALADKGYQVDLICLRGSGEPKKEIVHGVHVSRLSINRSRAGKLSYVFEYGAFTLISFLLISLRSVRRKYHLVHVHNMPDFLVFTALLPRLRGARIILDLHDPMPEVYMAKYGLEANHPFIRFMIWVEKLSIGFSHMVLTPNVAFHDLFISRGCPDDRIHIVMNTPQEDVFAVGNDAVGNDAENESARPDDPNKLNVMYHGTMVERHGLGTALEAVAKVRKAIPGIRFDVFGDGDYVEKFLERVGLLGLEDIVHYHGHVSQEKIAAHIQEIDLGIIPNKLSRFTAINFPTRIFEYLRYKKPVIVPRTQGIQDYFKEDQIFYFTPEDVDDLAEQLLKVHGSTDVILKVVAKGYEVYRNHSWAREKEHFVNLVNTL